MLEEGLSCVKYLAFIDINFRQLDDGFYVYINCLLARTQVFFLSEKVFLHWLNFFEQTIKET